ncbi:MAG TPA: DUF1501 domain-containing protein [Planctomycetes bacterium]|jgi:uncharacterized protein (DUF1501 family)|nr:DUF1501 domain-containing protein [Planctomycetota bacterium]
MNTHELFQRRDLLKLSAAGLLSGVSVPWFESMANAAEQVQRPRGKKCILLWMDGGPSQGHTFDPKPNGEFKSIPTTVPGIHVTEKFPKLAQCMEDMAFLRSMTTEINDHYDAKYYLHTGFRRVTNLEHPSIGSIASAFVGLPNDDMPAFVTIDAGNDKGNGGRFYRSVPAYLGPQHAPLAVQHPARGLENLKPDTRGLDRRLRLLGKGEERFVREYNLPVVNAKQAAFQRAVNLMHSPRARAFNLDDEPAAIREQYGEDRFGKSCLLARRLIESGVSFVEIFHRGWDDHEGAGMRIAARAPWMDGAMSTLILDLKQRGMLDDVLIVWMGEFGRTPGDGNGHFCRAWTSMMAGGGINTGQTVGATNETGKNPGDTITERPITTPDFMATLCTILGIDPHQELMASGDRPMPLVDKKAKLVKELIA